LRLLAIPRRCPHPGLEAVAWSFSSSSRLGRRVGVGDDAAAGVGPQARPVQAFRAAGFRDVAVEAAIGPQPEQGAAGRGRGAPRARFRPGVGGPQFRGAVIEPPASRPQQHYPPGRAPERELALHHRCENGAPGRSTPSPTKLAGHLDWCPARQTRPRSLRRQNRRSSPVLSAGLLGGCLTRGGGGSGVGLGIAMAGAGAFDRPGSTLALALTCRKRSG